jgi:DoxX-like family
MTTSSGNGKALNISLWAAQLLLAAAFGLFGSMKATQPLDQLATMMKWIPTMSPIFVRTLGTLEVLGAIGLVLPWLTGIKPRLTVAAALCFIVLQVLAIGLHVSRGEFAALGLNAVLIALAAFVFWGRRRSA